MTEPLFSLILVNWNTAELLVQAIESLREDAHTSRIPVEIVVSDNGSRDESVMRVQSRFPEVRVLENGRNLGFSRAVNRGLAVAAGKHVILFNTDARMAPGGLARLAQTLENHPKIGILGACLLNPDGTPQNTLAPFPSLATEVLNKSLLRALFPKKYRQKVSPLGVELVPAETLVGAFLAIRGETLSQIGPLDERFFFFFEETDWCYRAHLAGWTLAVDPNIHVQHGQGESSKPVLVETRIEFYRSRYRYFHKHSGALVTALLFECLLIKLHVEVLSALIMNLLALGRSAKWKNRLRVVATLLVWHIRGCPKSWGLEGKFRSDQEA